VPSIGFAKAVLGIECSVIGSAMREAPHYTNYPGVRTRMWSHRILSVPSAVCTRINLHTFEPHVGWQVNIAHTTRK